MRFRALKQTTELMSTGFYWGSICLVGDKIVIVVHNDKGIWKSYPAEYFEPVEE